jgi:hypothetical protein
MFVIRRGIRNDTPFLFSGSTSNGPGGILSGKNKKK